MTNFWTCVTPISKMRKLRLRASSLPEVSSLEQRHQGSPQVWLAKATVRLGAGRGFETVDNPQTATS